MSRLRYVLLGLGKLGGREMSYHSDLDLVLVYEGDGRTEPPPGAGPYPALTPTDNFHCFTELAQRVIKAMNLDEDQVGTLMRPGRSRCSRSSTRRMRRPPNGTPRSPSLQLEIE